MRPRKPSPIVLLLIAVLVAACGGGGGTATTTGGQVATTGEAGAGTTAELTPVRLQLQWVTQSQFAGYFAARDQGLYEAEGLEVEILEGAVDIVPQQVVASGEAEFGLSWVPKALVSNEEGAGLVNIAQVFQRSGTLEVSWADSGIATPADWTGKRVGTWGFGNEFELTAAIEKFDVTVDGELIQQPFDMSLLLNNELDAAQAMTYNEYAQVLEAENPETGELYTPEDLAVIDFNAPEIATAMLQDAVWVQRDWISDPANQDIAERFLRASFRGWIFCRDNFEACVENVLAAGPALGASHQTWQLNEINKLIWPTPSGIGVMDQALWDQTVEVAMSQAVITEPPAEDVFRTDLAEAAVAALDAEGLDTRGEGFEPVVVELAPGGE